MTKKIIQSNAVENRKQSSCMTKDLVQMLTALLVKDLDQQNWRFNLQNWT